jgi:hypothetical protein
MLQADKSASTTRWPRRANSASAVDLPVPDIPVIRTRVIPSKLSRPPQTHLMRSRPESSEATSKHAAVSRSGVGSRDPCWASNSEGWAPA